MQDLSELTDRGESDGGSGGSNDAGEAADRAPDVTTVEGATDTVVDTLRGIWADFLAHVPLLLGGLLVLLATLVVAWIAKLMTRRLLARVSMRQSLRELFERFAVVAVWIAGLLLSFMIVFPGLDPTDALAALGIGSIAIGLAFKDIFENLFAGVLILWRFPFENGDFIEC